MSSWSPSCGTSLRRKSAPTPDIAVQLMNGDTGSVSSHAMYSPHTVWFTWHVLYSAPLLEAPGAKFAMTTCLSCFFVTHLLGFDLIQDTSVVSNLAPRFVPNLAGHTCRTLAGNVAMVRACRSTGRSAVP